MHQVWEPALLRRLGTNKNVNGKRIVILYPTQDWDWLVSRPDYQCIYPAQEIYSDERTK